jgi:hypothetical protein
MAYLCIKFFHMPLRKEEFDVMKAHQFCDNRDCPKYGLVGQGNIKTHSFAVGQCYCNCCKSKPFVVRKGTMFYGLRTPIDKIVKVLRLLCSGMGQNAICRQEDVTGDSVRCWIILASEQVTAFTEYMQHDMHLEQVQIDEFWSFIRKKRELK